MLSEFSAVRLEAALQDLLLLGRPSQQLEALLARAQPRSLLSVAVVSDEHRKDGLEGTKDSYIGRAMGRSIQLSDGPGTLKHLG